jgi:arginine exporter protein ArgO
MREGCLGVLVTLVARVLSVVFVCVGIVLFLLGVFAFQPSFDFMTVVVAFFALGGAFLFVRIGQDVWTDLKEGTSSSKNPDARKDDDSDQGIGM